MTVRQLDRDEWHDFLENLTRTVRGRQTAVEIASADFGDQRLVENVPLLGLSYDTRGDMLEVEFETIGHRVLKPTALFVDQPPAGMIGIELEGSLEVGVGFLLLVSLVISAALAALNTYLSGWVSGLDWLWMIVDIVVSFLVVTLLFAMVYKILPDVELEWHDVWIGEVLRSDWEKAHPKE